MPTVDISRVARALNLKERRVQQLVHEGMPREARGQYDPIKCVKWYIRYLQHVLEKRGMPADAAGFVGEREERTRLLRANADLLEIKLAKARGLLVELPDVEKEFTDLVLTTKARILAVPARLAPELVGETSRVMIQAKLEKAFEESLSHLTRALNDGGNPTSRRADESKGPEAL